MISSQRPLSFAVLSAVVVVVFGLLVCVAADSHHCVVNPRFRDEAIANAALVSSPFTSLFDYFVEPSLCSAETTQDGCLSVRDEYFYQFSDLPTCEWVQVSGIVYDTSDGGSSGSNSTGAGSSAQSNGTAPSPTAAPPAPGGHGDPHFVGFRGQRFDFAGRPGEVFNLITDEHLQLNALFAAGLRSGTSFMGALAFHVGPEQRILLTCEYPDSGMQASSDPSSGRGSASGKFPARSHSNGASFASTSGRVAPVSIRGGHSAGGSGANLLGDDGPVDLFSEDGEPTRATSNGGDESSNDVVESGLGNFVDALDDSISASSFSEVNADRGRGSAVGSAHRVVDEASLSFPAGGRRLLGTRKNGPVLGRTDRLSNSIRSSSQLLTPRQQQQQPSPMVGFAAELVDKKQGGAKKDEVQESPDHNIRMEEFSQMKALYWNGVRIPLSKFRGFDLPRHQGFVRKLDSGDLTFVVDRYDFLMSFSRSVDSPCYINFGASYRDGSYERPHGILGQTSYEMANDATVSTPDHTGGTDTSGGSISGKRSWQGEHWIRGRFEDYRVRGDDLFGTDFVYNRFRAAERPLAEEHRLRVDAIVEERSPSNVGLFDDSQDGDGDDDSEDTRTGSFRDGNDDDDVDFDDEVERFDAGDDDAPSWMHALDDLFHAEEVDAEKVSDSVRTIHSRTLLSVESSSSSQIVTNQGITSSESSPAYVVQRQS